MSNKSKRRKSKARKPIERIEQWDAEQNHERPPSKMQGAQPLSPNEQAAAVRRVANVFRELAKPPEGILESLDRLEIPWYVGTLEDFINAPRDESVTNFTDLKGQFLIVSYADLCDGENRNQSKGSVLQGIYGDKQAELTGIFKQLEKEHGNNVQNG